MTIASQVQTRIEIKSQSSVLFRLIGVLRSESYTDSSRPGAVVAKRKVTGSKLSFSHRFVICLCNNSITVELSKDFVNMEVDVNSIDHAGLLAVRNAFVFRCC